MVTASRVLRVFVLAMAVAAVAVLQAQQRGGTPQSDVVQPVNTGANPYRIVRDWARLVRENRPWGGSNGVAIASDGVSVWATDRCSTGTAPGCLGSVGNPVHLFGEDGAEVRSFGRGMFVWPHGIHVDRDGNVWVTDARAPTPEELRMFPAEANKGSAVFKFSPDGRLLLTIGTPGRRGNPPQALTDPIDVVTDSSNGDVYIAESHTDVTSPSLVGRVSVFDRAGTFLRVIGRTGQGPGEFRTPHALEFDSRGRLIVADRHNHRIQVLTKAGTFVEQFFSHGRTSGLAIDAQDVIYTSDAESTAQVHPGWQRGIRIGPLPGAGPLGAPAAGTPSTAATVTMFIPPHTVPNSPDGAAGEGIAVDARGNIFAAEAAVRGVTKFVRTP